MKTVLLKIDDEIFSKVQAFLDLLPQQKIKVEIIENKEDKEQENLWTFLKENTGTMKCSPDESLEHDHYIYGTPKINNEKL